MPPQRGSRVALPWWVLLVSYYVVLVSQAPVVASASSSSSSASTTTASAVPLPFSPYGDTLVLHVVPTGSANDNPMTTRDTCGGDTNPCELHAALASAPPFTVLLLHPGVYRGSHRITTVVRFVAARVAGMGSDDAVVFDGEFRYRPLTFDGVPAWVEGVTFINGVGTEAGCVLVKRLSNHHGSGNNFTRCTFTNCTGKARSAATAGSRAVGGAVAIQYQYSWSPSFEVTRTVIENNYARGSAHAAGGMSVRYGASSSLPSSLASSSGARSMSNANGQDTSTSDAPASRGLLSASRQKYCSTMVLVTQQESLSHMNGAYRRVKGAMYGGKPVWTSVAAANTMVKGGVMTPHMIAYCLQQRTWHIVPILPGVSTSKALHQHPPCTSSVLTSSHRGSSLVAEEDAASDAPTKVTKWLLSNGNGAVEALRFYCQDAALQCPSIQLVHATGAQSHRNGLYVQTNLVRAGRPTFKKVFDGERLQYVWYCAGMKEWIVSDDDPTDATDQQTICSRGIATAETVAMHPILASGWRFWDLDLWRTSPTGRNGIRFTCSVPEPDLCQTVELVNGPMQDFHTGPYLLTGFQWNHRPTYALRPPHVSYIWFCGTFNEWVVSETDPKTLVVGDERCSRALSSHPTQAHTPYQLSTNWAQFLDEEWIQTTAQVRIRCVDDCPRIVVDALGYSPQYKHYLGVYESIGRLNPMYSSSASNPTAQNLSAIGDPTPSALQSRPADGHRVYRKLHHHEDVYLYFDATRSCWLISHSLDANEVSSIFVEACGGAPATSVFHAVNWSTPSSASTLMDPSEPSDASTSSLVVDPQPTFSCDLHQHCRRINISAVLYLRQEYLIGVYEPLPYLHNHRPIFLHNYTSKARASQAPLHYMYYCSVFAKWVVGPEPNTDGRCQAWIASKSTSSTHPLNNVHWVLHGDGVKWETSTFGIRMGCADDELHFSQMLLQNDEVNTDINSPSTTLNEPRGDTPSTTQRGNGHIHEENAAATRVQRKPPSNKQSTATMKKSVTDFFFGGSASWDTFTDCNFSHNFALGDTATLVKTSLPVVSNDERANGDDASNAIDVSGGAIAVDYGNTAVGDEPSGLMRRTTLSRNEAFGSGSAGGVAVFHAGSHRWSALTWTDVTIHENRGETGGAVLSSIRLSSTRVNVVRNYAFRRGGGLALTDHSNVSGSFWQCRSNYAMVDGGCSSLDATSVISLSRSDIVNNSALRNSGTTFSGGSVVISESKVLSVFQYAIRAFFLMLSSSELNCAAGTPISITDGFGCLPNPPEATRSAAEGVSASSWYAAASQSTDGGSAESVSLQNSGGDSEREWWTYIVDALLLTLAAYVTFRLWSGWSSKKKK